MSQIPCSLHFREGFKILHHAIDLIYYLQEISQCVKLLN